MLPAKVYFVQLEANFLQARFSSSKNGHFQKITESIIKRKLKSNFVAVTHSCSAALEISAILINLKPGDEVIIPSYGFVSIANAIIMRGAKPVFVEVNSKTLNICTKDIIKQIKDTIFFIKKIYTANL